MLKNMQRYDYMDSICSKNMQKYAAKYVKYADVHILHKYALQTLLMDSDSVSES